MLEYRTVSTIESANSLAKEGFVLKFFHTVFRNYETGHYYVMERTIPEEVIKEPTCGKHCSKFNCENPCVLKPGHKEDYCSCRFNEIQEG